MKIIKAMLVACIVCSIAVSGFAEPVKRIATVTEVKGTVEIKDISGVWQKAKAGMIVGEGDIITTKADSVSTIALSGPAEASVSMKPNSQLAISELVMDKKEGTQSTLLDLAIGEILIKTQKLHSKESRFEVKTPTSIVGVRGTVFSVAVEAVE